MTVCPLVCLVWVYPLRLQVYAFGMVLNEMLTGNPPYFDLSLGEAAPASAHFRCPSLQLSLHPGLTPFISAIPSQTPHHILHTCC